ncbi:Uncharacterised protein [Legionella busanensis]|uniref:Uncharacterized protein n=1 Tax=Legionella busanensis TaxID=190655 RepID=A0A378JKP1_9GAMM|nr:hypothetical protein [Legionella busanensis]STX51248.1 Uncharacterised protein [Legionella busanensis]
MGPIAIAVICAAVFGVVSTITAFIHRLLASRDKRLNDLAQAKALTQETTELEKLRHEMLSYKRYNAYYQVLGENKEAIQYLDQKIEEILKKKSALIERYAQAIVKESNAIVTGNSSPDRKIVCDKLRQEIDNQLKTYDIEIKQLQTRRSNLWNSNKELQDYILEQEKKRNEHMDAVYQQHSALLEKIFLRHTDNTENITKTLIDSTTQTFKSLITAPIEFLAKSFRLTRNASSNVAKQELLKRQNIAALEALINGQDEVGSPGFDRKNKQENDKMPLGYTANFSFNM